MINLLPYKEKKIIEKIRNIGFVQMILLGIILLEIIFVFLLFPAFLLVNSRFKLVESQIEVLEKSGAITNSVDLDNLIKKSQFVVQKLSIATNVQTTDYINFVKSIKAKGVSVDRFVSSEDKTLEISGVSTNREDLQSFIKTLEEDNKVASVDSPVSNFVKNKDNEFMLKIYFK